MRKGIVVSIVCFSLCVICSVCLMFTHFSQEIARDHYSVTEHKDGYSTCYGCGDFDCKYCKGRSNGANDQSFVYYRQLSTVFDVLLASIIVTGIAGGASVVYTLVKRSRGK